MGAGGYLRRWVWLGVVACLLLAAASVAPLRVGAATLHVTDCGDSGANTLRGRLAAAATSGDTIVWDQDCTTTLASTLTLTKNVTVDGSGHTVILDGGCTGCDPGGTASGGVSVFFVNDTVTVSISNLTIRHGNAGNGYGGGINQDGGTLTLTNVTLSGNRAGSGGGINSGGGTTTLTNTSLVGNHATIGGGIFNSLGGRPSVVNSTLSGNSAGSVGGGIYNENGVVAVVNSTLSSNSAGSRGGGIYNTATVTLTNSTLSGNSAAVNGGGIYTLGGATLTNTIVADSSSGGDLNGTFDGNNNLIGDGTGTLTGSSNLRAAPLLGTLGNYGGPTQTFSLLPGSPAIGAGNPAACAAPPVSGVDQRGAARAAGSCAIGAFEPRVLTVGTPSDTGGAAPEATCLSAANTACRLRDAVGYANADSVQFNSTGRGTITLGSTLTLAQPVTIQGPTSGAAVIVDGGCTANCGTASAVGGVGVFQVNPGATVGISDLTIRNGNATTGGGILNNGTLAVTNVALSGNRAGTSGGGILNGGTLTVTNSALSGNSSGTGGGIRNSGGTATVTGSTFSGNSVSITGGGIYNTSGTMTVTNGTFSGNSANFGGGIANSGTLAVTSSTLSGNSAVSVGGIVSAGTTTLTNTIVANSTGGDLSGTSTGDNNLIGDQSGTLTGSNNQRAAPLLGPLGDYGGATQTFPLLPGSPAIDAGAAIGSGPPGAAVPGTDQRGVARVGTPDIGAFESRGFTLAKFGGDNQSATVGTGFAPLVVTVASANGEPVDGGIVSFSGPTTGGAPGIAASPLTATIGAATSGRASVTPTANATVGGPYTVTAAVATGTAPASVAFSLTNTPGAATQFTLSGAETTPAGQEYQLTVTARDALGNIATGYRGTVHLSSTDPNARLAPDHTFTAAENGTYTVTVTLNTEGERAISATDTATSSVTGARGVRVTGPSGFSGGPALTAVLPRQGPTAGGTTITITGAGFTSVQSVTVGGVACTNVQVSAQGTAQQMTCVTGAHAAGTVDVVVTTATGTATAPGAYVYGVPGSEPGGRSGGGGGNPNPEPAPRPGSGQPGSPNPAPAARP